MMLQKRTIKTLYSISNSSTISLAFPKFSSPFHISNSTVNPFYCTKYLPFPLIHCLFRIFSISHSFSTSTITEASCSFFCPATCPTYLCTLLTFTTGCIFTIGGRSNLTAFTNTISLILYGPTNLYEFFHSPFYHLVLQVFLL